MAGSFVTTGVSMFAMTPDNAFIYMQENGLIRMISIATRNLAKIMLKWDVLCQLILGETVRAQAQRQVDFV